MSAFVQYQVLDAAPRHTQIQIEPGWQQLAVPAKYGKWSGGALVRGAPDTAKVGEYVLDQLVSKYGAGCVEVCTTKNGDKSYQWNFLPTTPRGSEHNFALMTLDANTGIYEVTGFWIKSLYNTTMTLDVIEWRV